MHSEQKPAIGVYQVGKTYRVYGSSWDRLRAHLLEAMPKPTAWLREKARAWLRKIGREFRALEDVTLEIQPGESVGIIGRNGSGKSTLLQIIAGTRPPTCGSVKVRGRVAAILELGSGFKPDFTGRENVFINGLILGLSHAEITAKFPQIEAFADIGGFMDQPVKTYSSGMLVRLVFSVQVALEPDVLIVDEALAVGDVFFQQKCAERMKELKAKGTTILFVSHSMQVVRNLCEKVAYLKDGRLEFFGPTLAGTTIYFTTTGQSRSRRDLDWKKTSGPAASSHPVLWEPKESPDTPVMIAAVRLPSDRGTGSLEGQIGQMVALEVEIVSLAHEPVAFHLGFSLKNSFGQLLHSSGTHTAGEEAFALPAGMAARVNIAIPLQLEAGSYTFNIGVGHIEGINQWVRLHGTGWLGPLTISGTRGQSIPPFYGPFGLPVQIDEFQMEPDPGP
jgi:lipopolysaccharide transport system ATP-binding protein